MLGLEYPIRSYIQFSRYGLRGPENAGIKVVCKNQIIGDYLWMIY